MHIGHYGRLRLEGCNLTAPFPAVPVVPDHSSHCRNDHQEDFLYKFLCKSVPAGQQAPKQRVGQAASALLGKPHHARAGEHIKCLQASGKRWAWGRAGQCVGRGGFAPVSRYTMKPRALFSQPRRNSAWPRATPRDLKSSTTLLACSLTLSTASPFTRCRASTLFAAAAVSGPSLPSGLVPASRCSVGIDSYGPNKTVKSTIARRRPGSASSTIPGSTRYRWNVISRASSSLRA